MKSDEEFADICRDYAQIVDEIARKERTLGRATLELADGTSLLDLIQSLDIDDKLAQMVLVNGQQAPRPEARRAGVALVEGDTVAIFPPLAGG